MTFARALTSKRLAATTSRALRLRLPPPRATSIRQIRRTAQTRNYCSSVASYGGGNEKSTKQPQVATANSGKVTVLKVAKKHHEGEAITMLTAYDVAQAKLAEAAGVDIILVGDSLGMVMMGRSGTVDVTMDEMN